MIIVTTSSGRHWQSNTETVSAPVLRQQWGGTRGCAGGIACSLGAGRGGRFGPSPWMDARLQPVLGAALSSRVQGFVGPPWLAQPGCPGTGWHVPLVAVPGCGAQPHRSTHKLWLFLYFFRVFFFAFLAANLPLQVPWRKQDCAQRAAALPAPPHRGQSRGAAPGKGARAGARPLPPCPVKSPRWSWQFAVLDRAPPPLAIPQGIGAGPRVEWQRTGTAQCLCEHVAAWDGAARDGWGKNKNPPKRG